MLKDRITAIFMATGALMYVVPYFRLNGSEIIEAILVGLFFSLFLIFTSNFEVKGSEIYMKRSKLFPVILISLLIIRSVGKFFLSDSIDPGQLAGMFFLLAFSMIVPWRIAMYVKYKKLKDRMPIVKTTHISIIECALFLHLKFLLYDQR